jgi:hypothetical protein
MNSVISAFSSYITGPLVAAVQEHPYLSGVTLIAAVAIPQSFSISLTPVETKPSALSLSQHSR